MKLAKDDARKRKMSTAVAAYKVFSIPLLVEKLDDSVPNVCPIPSDLFCRTMAMTSATPITI
jgi:hypothetical protein